MWDKLKAAAQHPAAQLLKKLCGDPVQLYSVFLVMTSMYYYHEDWTWLYTIITIFVSFVLNRFYDFVARRRFLGPICYLIFLFAGLYGVNMITAVGQRTYPITFMVWFLTPQSVVDFSMLYTIAIYLLMTGFLTSAVYYFAKVRYRMVMQFLIMLIPLSLYAKEGLQMPAILVIVLLASYFLLMVYCRQLREAPQVRQLHSFHGGISIAAYVMMFSIIAAIVPKPAVTADREFIENAMSYSTWSDVLMNAIRMFTETTDNQVSTSNSAMTLYYVDAPESLRLRTQTYTYYGEDDSWTVTECDRPSRSLPEYELTYKPQALLQAIVDTAAEDPEFAQEYGLTDVAGKTMPEQKEYELYIYPRYRSWRVLPSPTRTVELTDGVARKDVRLSDTNAFEATSTGTTMLYYPDAYARYSEVSDMLDLLHRENYIELLEDAYILAEEDERKQILYDAWMEARDAADYLELADGKDWQSEIIDDLAAQLTEGLNSDFEKALAIERYFVEAEYVYDDAYQKEEGENIGDFLTTSHRGVCYEYATAMVLLCRSAGLPARYVQGYNMSEQYDSNTTSRFNPNGRKTNYVIKARNAHAFPEVYISGYGWLSFEPTVPSDDVGDSAAENIKVMQWGYVLLAAAVIALLIYLLLPYIRERQFRRRIKTMSAQACASAVFRRMRTQLRLPDSTTVRELAVQSAPFYQRDAVFDAMDALLYQPENLPAEQQESLAVDYIQWHAEKRLYEKEQRKRRRSDRSS